MKKTIITLLLLCCVFAAAAVPAWAEESGIRANAVSELYSAEGIYQDSLRNTESYLFHVPQLTADTPAAAEINAEIRERFGERVEEQLQNMAEGYSIWSWNTGWHAYWNGNQLFLLVSSDMEGGFTDYAAYGYDFDADCRIDNAMILRQRGISEEEYLENLREKVRFMFEDRWSIIPVEERERLGYDELLEKTVAWADPEQPMFVDGSGQIVTIVKIASVAGAEWYYHLATPFSYG